jgi:hypothetical protein
MIMAESEPELDVYQQLLEMDARRFQEREAERGLMERALAPLLQARGIPADDPNRWLELALFLAHEAGELRGAGRKGRMH